MIKNIQGKAGENWNSSEVNVFWGEIAPCNHVVQVYEDEQQFLDTLAGFVGTGINSGDCIVVIATPSHLQQLREKLEAHGIKIDYLIDNDVYIPLKANEVLSKFMVNDWPDENLFSKCITEIFERAKQGGRHVRAFGEMVAMLWAQGHHGATVRLESLWDDYCHKHPFSLFCAYPKAGFTQDMLSSLEEICFYHAKMITNSGTPSEILFKDYQKGMAV
jgi:hypothetical protein